MYRLVAYHNHETKRESLDLSTSLVVLKNQAKKLDVNKYQNNTLHIEDRNGNTVSIFHIKNNSFVEKEE